MLACVLTGILIEVETTEWGRFTHPGRPDCLKGVIITVEQGNCSAKAQFACVEMRSEGGSGRRCEHHDTRV